jgi:nucleoside-diphosphate-sugar epimerase
MSTLLCFGLGYAAEHFIGRFGDSFDRLIGTVRSVERAAVLNARFAGRLKVFAFDGFRAVPAVESVVRTADLALASIPPGLGGDPVLAAFSDALAQAPHLRSIIYLSSVGVYGDHRGGWVDETTRPQPCSERSRARLAAEQAWEKFGALHARSVVILRLAGIYGPGRNVLLRLARGTARHIVKPDQVFCRIHVADIAETIDAAFARAAAGIFNVSDDEPAPPGDAVVFAARLLGLDPPPQIPFAEAAPSLSPAALSFWQECRRVGNDKMKRELGVTLQYPTYREGLRALAAAP